MLLFQRVETAAPAVGPRRWLVPRTRRRFCMRFYPRRQRDRDLALESIPFRDDREGRSTRHASFRERANAAGKEDISWVRGRCRRRAAARPFTRGRRAAARRVTRRLRSRVTSCPGAAASTRDASDHGPGSEGSREERGSGAAVASLTCASVLDHAGLGSGIRC